MNDILKLGLKLLLICLVSAGLLAVTNELTKDKIIEQRNLVNQQARQEVLSDAESFDAVDQEILDKVIAQNPNVVEIFTAKKGGETIGYVIKTTPSGFGGPVEVITGIDTEGKITGVRTGSHNETPGLGANVTLPYFYTQYEGMGVNGSVDVSKTEKTDTAIMAVSGATISSRAVTTGVNYSLEAYGIITK